MALIRGALSFLGQIVVCAIVLVAIAAAAIWLEPNYGRVLLAANPPFENVLRRAVVAVAPEAGDPAAEIVGPTPARGPRGGGAVVVAGTVGEALAQTRMRALATGEAENSVVVRPDNTSGMVEDVLVRAGSYVERGDVLVRLERRAQEIAVERARVELQTAERTIERYRRLSSSSAVSGVEVENAESTRAAVLLDLAEAELALSKRIIRAPMAGRVGIVTVDPGDLVSTETALTTIDDRDRIRLVFYTPERFVSELAEGMPVEATAIANPAQVFRGEISALDSRLDGESRTLRTEALIDNPDDVLRPGMGLAVVIALDGEPRLAVDPLAVVWERSGPIVWKIVEGRVEKAPVRVISREVDRLLIASEAISRGETIVVEGLQALREGAEVSVTDTREAPSDPAGTGDPLADATVTQQGTPRDIAAPAQEGSLPASTERRG